VNLGSSGYGPQQELAVLKRFGLSYQPRVVVWQMTEWNDVEDAQNYLLRNKPGYQPRLGFRFYYMNYSPLARLLTSAFPGPRLFDLQFRRSDGVIETSEFWPLKLRTHEAKPIGLAETTRSIAAAHALCRERGIQFVVAFVPSTIRVLYPSLVFKSPAQRERFCPRGIVDDDRDLGHVIAKTCRELGCPMLDVCPPLRRRAAADNRRIYVKNDTHLDVDGHDEVSRAVAGWIREQGVVAWSR
jgi:hypothetical protein